MLAVAPSVPAGVTGDATCVPMVLGAKGIDELSPSFLSAAMPSFVAGLKNGWTFAWRSLMARSGGS